MPNQYKNIDKIAQLNDFLRGYILTATPVKDKIVITEGVSKLDKQIQKKVFQKVKNYKDFDEDNNRFGERDFVAYGVNGMDFFWKISYYDNNMKYHSEDKSDPEKTTRVLTIMRSEEW